MDKMDLPVMVVNRDVLFSEKYFEGFLPAKEYNYEARILANYEYIRRGDAEEDFTKKQPIGYAVIWNPIKKKVFVYTRSKDLKNYSEKRLSGKVTCGVGGHIDKIDEVGNPITESMLRELSEEVNITGKKNMKILGYVNMEDTAVNKVHFAILFLVETTGDVTPRGKEMAKGQMISLEELNSMCSSSEFEVEGWTKTAVNALNLMIN
jgi:predicted NUDIX family phosphoesterase